MVQDALPLSQGGCFVKALRNSLYWYCQSFQEGRASHCENNMILIQWDLFHSSGLSTLAAASHVPSQTNVPGPVCIAIGKKQAPERKVHTYPLAAQRPLQKSTLRQHRHSLWGQLPCSRQGWGHQRPVQTKSFLHNLASDRWGIQSPDR